MNTEAYKKIKRYRVRDGLMGSTEQMKNNGVWVFRYAGTLDPIRVIASDGGDWDHVSVSMLHQIPTWEVMCWIKDIFWNKEETVMQLHPPSSEYINLHPNVLHMWKPQKALIPMPPLHMV